MKKRHLRVVTACKLVVRSGDGRRWACGEPADHPHGQHYLQRVR